MSESIVDLSPQASEPEIGKLAWVIGGSMARDNTNATILAARDGNVAILEWWDPDYHLGPQWRSQCYRTDRLTSSREVANASWIDLKMAGWNV